MKNNIKWTFLVTSFFFGVLQSKAQGDNDKFESGIHLGAKAGINYANVFDEQGDDFVADGKFGFAGGGFVSFPLGLKFAIQPEFLISQKGFKATGSILGFDYELKRTSTYIDVPIYFAWRPIPVVTLLAGPQFSYLVKQRDDFTSSVTSFFAEQEFKNENLRKNLLCFIGGLDLNFQYIVVGARAGFDFQNNQGDGTNSVPRYKNVWLQGTLGFRF